MANLNAALQHIKRTRDRQRRGSPKPFDRFRADYETTLRATEAIAGDPAFDELLEWMIARTESTHQLPSPSEVRQQAREICRDRGVDVPRDSPLRGE